MRFWRYVFLIGITSAMVGCSAQANTAPAVTLTPLQVLTTTLPQDLTSTQTPISTDPEQPAPDATNIASTNSETVPTSTYTQSPTRTLFPTPTFNPETWAVMPVIPKLGPRALDILKDGLAMGNNPHAFAKIGDCESQASWFLGDFDLGPKYYSLGSYETDLTPVVPYFAGSYKRISLAARPGFTAASLMAPIWSDKQVCQKGEGPLACEYRVQRPIMAFIMLGSNDASNPKTFEGHMRKIIQYSIDQGVLPVLGTKADNVEKDYFVNKTIARLAAEYDVPLWNFWAAVQDLPDHGLQGDGVHLTFGTPRFDDAANMKNAWPVRNLNALQILKQVMDQLPQ
jgi:hypothetical protein